MFLNQEAEKQYSCSLHSNIFAYRPSTKNTFNNFMFHRIKLRSTKFVKFCKNKASFLHSSIIIVLRITYHCSIVS